MSIGNRIFCACAMNMLLIFFIIILEIFFSELKFTKWLYKTYMESHVFRFSLFGVFVFIAPGFFRFLGIKIPENNEE